MKECSLNPRFASCQSETPDGAVHKVHWTDWGAKDHPHIVICAHGLTRNGRDFDYLAQQLGKHCRVICPDYPGRGKSPKLANLKHYSLEQYVKDTFALIGNLDYAKLDWIGTSMGGLIGMAIASMPNCPISNLAINDIGPEIHKQGMIDLVESLSDQPSCFDSMEEVYDYFKESYPGFGKLEEHHYRHMGDHGVWSRPDGTGYELARDPAIVEQIASLPASLFDWWDMWKKITIPTLIIRGEDSELLLPGIAQKMVNLHAGASLIEFADCAHAPSLMVHEHISEIMHWFGFKDIK